MRILIIAIIIFTMLDMEPSRATNEKGPGFVLVIHGGAGTILPQHMTPQKEKAYQQSLENALQKGYEILKRGGSSLDAVETAVRLLEDDPLFNAGRGSVFTHDGKIELDASIMEGKSLAAGAVAAVTTIKNPVTAARRVMEKSGHVMLIGKGAEDFSNEQGLEMVDQRYFFTQSRWDALQAIRDSSKTALDHGGAKELVQQPEMKDAKFGTVGAVALDRAGNLAAATSTGGMTNKKFGRVGDAPIIGAGTYADNNTCAVSCTGWGEYFIRLVVAKSVSDQMEYKKVSLARAAEDLIMNRVPKLGGDGGLIAVDKNGNISMPFNTAGMYRGYIKSDGKAVVKIYAENKKSLN
ncbi:MAG TPA: isoaspartyl peptidase/L-asparaginase [Chitinophagaceae bacterium]|nr:isoaspartyl peptidase/L-asparaginase [Chitinophagaceae bacterium]